MKAIDTPKFSTMTEEHDLILKAQQGDMLAFEQLVFRHDRKVLSLAARYVTRADDAKDIYQEVFLRVYRGLKKFRFQSEFATWVHRITVNVCLTHRSRERRAEFRHVRVSAGEDDGEADGAMEPVATEDPPDRRAMNADLAMHVERALVSLSPRQRLAFTLKHYEGYTLKEIAAMMNCVEGTVKRYLFSATRRMRDQLKDAL
jgi:RNA polymerase sigma-70 factor (ECF subfamily)